MGGNGKCVGIGGGGGARLLSGVMKSLAEGWVLRVKVEFVRSSGTKVRVSADRRAFDSKVVLERPAPCSGVGSWEGEMG